jgi:hypothetical protein
MDRAQLLARLVAELATARAAISASYLRLWRPAERTVADATGVDRRPGPEPGGEAGAVAEEERPARDGGR